MSKFASATEVSVSKTRAEIENALIRYGASQFVSGWNDRQAVLGFSMADRQVKFILPMPSCDDLEIAYRKVNASSKVRRTEQQINAAIEQEQRRLWRALLLIIKAKLEAVESGISIFEDEFLANIVLPDGNLVGQWMRPQIANAYQTRDMPPLLPSPDN